MTKAEVHSLFPALLSTWRALPDVRGTDEQNLRFSDFYSWLRDSHPDATRFRSVMGPREDLEQWFDVATRQGWRN